LLADCAALRNRDKRFTLVLSCHSPGFSLLVLERMIREAFPGKGDFESFEMTIPESTGRVLPAGITATWIRK
jgi:23S rRNA (cytosine1962-C5)-methyltransferase